MQFSSNLQIYVAVLGRNRMFHCVVWLCYHCSVELPLRVELIRVALTYQVFIAPSTLIGTYTDACTHAQHQFSNSHANVITPLTLNSLNTRWDGSIQIWYHSHELLNTNVTQLLSATAFKKRWYTCSTADEAWYWPKHVLCSGSLVHRPSSKEERRVWEQDYITFRLIFFIKEMWFVDSTCIMPSVWCQWLVVFLKINFKMLMLHTQ